ncbi:hypothetical protein BC835DRAFT_1525838 [Cytidiella melzeri]|nr:hypothetical protein BC835DRAFT_1525838 [Cytidiella melzeri]
MSWQQTCLSIPPPVIQDYGLLKDLTTVELLFAASMSNSTSICTDHPMITKIPRCQPKSKNQRGPAIRAATASAGSIMKRTEEIERDCSAQIARERLLSAGIVASEELG